LSATGTLAYVPDTGETEQGELVWVDRNGEIGERALATPIERPSSPRLSPDGRRVALRTGSQGGQNIWVYALDGRPPIPLTVDGNNGMPAWSPDGTRVAFNSNRGGGFALYTVPADGSVLDPQPLRPDGLDLNPLVWSVDEELILLRCCAAEDLLEAGLEPDAELHDVVVTDGLEYDAALSPNGRWLAYANDRTGQAEIWVKRYPDGVPVRVSSTGGIEPRWSHDGRELFYLSGNAMMAVPVEAENDFSFSAAVELFDGPYRVSQGPYDHSYDVSSDGRFLMILPSAGADGAEGRSSIVVVENWFEELKRLVPTE
jgi:Tol biopolymer transport system component